MDITAAATLARSLMVEHGVGSLSFGIHHYSDRPEIVGRTHKINSGGIEIWSKITLDLHWIYILPENKVREVILHEIAHALSPVDHPAHGSVWGQNCFKLGIAPNSIFKHSTTPDTMKIFPQTLDIDA